MGFQVIHLAVVPPFPLSPLLFPHKKTERPPMLAVVEGEELRSIPKEKAVASRVETKPASKNKKEQLHQTKVFFFMPSYFFSHIQAQIPCHHNGFINGKLAT